MTLPLQCSAERYCRIAHRLREIGLVARLDLCGARILCDPRHVRELLVNASVDSPRSDHDSRAVGGFQGASIPAARPG